MQPATAMNKIKVKTILNKTKHRDSWFLDDYTLNPYSGCSYNCLYCYTRGTKYGIHLERKTAAKVNAVELLDKQLALRAKKKQYGFIGLASSTDPYLHFEEELQLTKRLLEVILKYRFPVHVLTKSTLIERDFDLLKQIDQQAILPEDLQDKINHGCMVSFSFSTLKDDIGHIFEPGAPLPSARLETLKKAVAYGLFTGVSLMPLLPFISDLGEHLEEMFLTFKEAQIEVIFPASITLSGEGEGSNKFMMLAAVVKHYPHLLAKYEQWFANDYQMPEYYRNAFYKKMKELCLKYGLKDRLI
jgi:DNA repair photolyase